MSKRVKRRRKRKKARKLTLIVKGRSPCAPPGYLFRDEKKEANKKACRNRNFDNCGAVA